MQATTLPSCGALFQPRASARALACVRARVRVFKPAGALLRLFGMPSELDGIHATATLIGAGEEVIGNSGTYHQ